MTGRHESPPVGSAAREATATPYIGTHRKAARACGGCGGSLSAYAGFFELYRQPQGELEGYCSLRCLHEQLHEEQNQ